MKIALTPFHRRLLVQLAIALGAVLILSLAVFFMDRRISTQVERVAELRRDIALRNHTLELLAGSNNDLARSASLFKNLELILPEKDTLLGFSRDIKKYGQQFGVSVGFSFGVETQSSAAQAGTVNFSLTATGAYEDLVEFFAFLERHPYFIHFDGFSLTYVKDGSYTVTTSGLIYTK